MHAHTGTEAEVAAAFEPGVLQRLMDSCPTPDAQQLVWRMAEALPSLPAARQLQSNLLQLLGSGQLVASVEAGAPSERERQQQELGAVLAALAAGPAGPKMAAMLCQALAVEWRSAPESAAPPGACGACPADGDDIDMACWGCGCTEPEDTMLLCDGCEGAYHTNCLRPALELVPEGDWFCPGCQGDIQACELSTDAAIR